jgi:hypothetical protein
VYWVGLALALVSGLLSNRLFRNEFSKLTIKIDADRADTILIVLLVAGLSVATIRYTWDQGQIQLLKDRIELSEYQEASTYNASGNKSGKVAGIPMVPTPIDDWNKDFVSRREGDLVCTCNASALEQCHSVIQKLPAYPFAYYFLAVCQKQNGDPAWKLNAEKANRILARTTRIPGCHSDHVRVLESTIKLLQK